MSLERFTTTAALRQLREQAFSSPRGGSGFVFGEGCPEARLMIVGEAPGREEERLGRPFVGRAGKFLNRLLQEAGIPREETWITNVAKRRPTRIKRGRLSTRPPTVAEIKADLPWLQGEISIIRPRVILCLGAVSARALIAKDFRLLAQRGRWFPGFADTQALATFHPAYLLRQSILERERLIHAALQDLSAARARCYIVQQSCLEDLP